MKNNNDKSKDNKNDVPGWQHPGGKLLECGADSLSDAELIAILISSGIKGKTAETIAQEIMNKYGSFKGMTDQPFEKFLRIKGLGDVKILRIFAAFEIARRCVHSVIKELKEDKELRKEVLGE
jgi:DNA repair protein RadC